MDWSADGGLAAHVDGLVKTYRQGEGRVAALRGVTLAVRGGEFVAVMGPSGSGKSTLLHLLGGLDVPDRGGVVVGGRALQAMTDDQRTVFRRRHVGVVFQAFNLVPTLTVEENVALPLRLDGLPNATVGARVAAVLAEVGLERRRLHAATHLSGGEQQRVAIARALVVEPMLILADEPTGNLDSRTAGEVLRLLRLAASERARTLVMVTHDAGAAAHADRVVRVVDGRVEADGSGANPSRDGVQRCVRGA
jgi:putative ABC transport system ATP-binding protein